MNAEPAETFDEWIIELDWFDSRRQQRQLSVILASLREDSDMCAAHDNRTPAS